MKRVQYHLTEVQINKLKEMSKKSGITFAELIRRAVDNFIRKEEGGRKK